MDLPTYEDPKPTMDVEFVLEGGGRHVFYNAVRVHKPNGNNRMSVEMQSGMAILVPIGELKELHITPHPPKPAW